MRRRPIIAIDGPVGAGKSTLARRLARRLGFTCVDSGAMYRAVALRALRRGVDLGDAQALAGVAAEAHIAVRWDGERSVIELDGEDVTAAIRSAEVSRASSVVSTLPAVRARLVAMQKAMGSDGGLVMEGRDIGTVVFPDAELKFYVEASLEERGRRRFTEGGEGGGRTSLAETIADVASRDARDAARAHSPLLPAADAIRVDTTGLAPEAVVQAMLAEVRRRTGVACNT